MAVIFPGCVLTGGCICCLTHFDEGIYACCKTPSFVWKRVLARVQTDSSLVS